MMFTFTYTTQEGLIVDVITSQYNQERNALRNETVYLGKILLGDMFTHHFSMWMGHGRKSILLVEPFK